MFEKAKLLEQTAGAADVAGEDEVHPDLLDAMNSRSPRLNEGAFRVSVSDDTMSEFGNATIAAFDEGGADEGGAKQVGSDLEVPDDEFEGAHQKDPNEKGDGKVADAPARSLETLERDVIKQRLGLYHDVQIVEKNGRYEYHMKANGKDQLLFSSDKSLEAMRAAESRIAEMERAKAREIEGKYGAQIAGAGEKVAINKQHPDEACRQPSLAELAGLEASLAKNTTGLPSGVPVKFYFLKNQIQTPQDLAQYKSVNGQPAVIIEPNASYKRPPTERDAESWNGNDERGNSLEATITHELAHHSENRRGPEVAPPVALPPELATPGRDTIHPRPGPTQRAKDLDAYERMAWKKVGDWWALEGADGNLYRPKPGTPPLWMQINDKGQFIDRSGNVTSDERRAETRTNEQMQGLARMTPASDYFRQPHEMYAEGLAHLRMGANSRAELIQTSPQLYQLMKQRDQEDIDRRLGKGLYLRSPDGTIVPNNAASQKQVEDFERRHRVKAR